MSYIRATNRNQIRIPLSLDETIPIEHAIRIIDEIIDRLFPKTDQESTDGRGRPSYSDIIMMKLFIYGYMNGIKSSRRLEIECKRNLELRWLIQELTPDHWTINNWRKSNIEKIKEITRELRRFLRESSYATLEEVAIDGTKIKANTSKEMLTKAQLTTMIERENERLSTYLEELENNDIIDESKEAIRKREGKKAEAGKKEVDERIKRTRKRLKKYEEMREELSKQKKKRISRSDYEVDLLKSRDGFIPGYNVQVIGDSKNRMIMDSEAYVEATDINLLPEVIASLKEEVEAVPGNVLVDKGYNNADDIERIEKESAKNGEAIKIYSPIKEEKKEEIEFSYDKQADEYTCSQGKKLKKVQSDVKKKNSMADVYRCKECEGCPMRNKCTESKHGRIKYRYKNQEWRDTYKEMMKESNSKERIKRRGGMIEHLFGNLKIIMGKIPLLLRGKDKVNAEINLYTTGYNIKRLLNIDTRENILANLREYAIKMA